MKAGIQRTAQEFDFQDELQKMWLEVELYMMQVK